jgi:hypothetical protein
MKLLLLIATAFSLVQANAKTNHLSHTAQLLNISKNINDFIERAAGSDVKLKWEMKSYAQSRKVNELPKATYENNVLTLTTSDKSTAKIEMKKNEFKINGTPINLDWQDTYTKIAEKIEKTFADNKNKKSAWFNLLIPEAHGGIPFLAGVALFAVTTIGGYVYINGLPEYFNMDCKILAKKYKEVVDDVAGDSVPPISFSKVFSCSKDQPTVEVIHRGGGPNTLVKFVRDPQMPTKGSIQEYALDEKTKIADYQWVQEAPEKAINYQGTEKNGQPLSKEFGGDDKARIDFDTYVKLLQPLAENKAKGCSQCVETINRKARFGTFDDKKGKEESTH